MKGTNPVIPPGINFEGAKRGRSNMRVAVIVVVLLHIALFTGILFNACKQKDADEGAGKTTAEEMAQIVAPQPNPSILPQPSGPAPLPANPELPPLPDTVGTTLPPVPPPTFQGNPLGLSSAAGNQFATPHVLPPPSLANTEHVVASGESFWTIGRKYGVSHQAIEQANPNVIPTRMKIGQKIIIPAKSVPTPAPAPIDDGTSYTVKSGDTLGHIALSHRVKVDDLKAANPNIVPTRMKIGQKLKLPTGASRSTRPPSTSLQPFPGSDTSSSPPVDPATGLPILPLPPGASSPTP